MDEKKINFVSKQVNPSNIPQSRPIESFWGDLAQKVNTGGWEAKIREQLVDLITYFLLLNDRSFKINTLLIITLFDFL